MNGKYDMENEKRYGLNYIDTLKFIREQPDKKAALETILQTKSSCIPDVLFKYISLTEDEKLNKQKLDTLRNQQIYMSSCKELNDPFDSKGYFYKPEQLLKFDRLKHCGGKLIDDFSSFSRIASFTSCGVNSMPMWAHYASNHMGFCVSYEMNESSNSALKGCMFPVQYIDKRIDITELMIEQAEQVCNAIDVQEKEGKKEIILNDLTLPFLTSFFVNLKHFSWDYEEEYRCTVGEGYKENPYFSAKPKSLYIGSKCKPVHATQLIAIAKEIAVPIYLMQFNESSKEYELQAKLITA